MASLARLLLALALVIGPAPLVAQSHGGSHSYSRHSIGSGRYAPKSYTHHHSSAAVGPRDRHGRLKRSAEAKRDFERESGHPHGWPGHVVDHIVPLACGGADSPSNMQWQTTAEAKAKDRVERRGCR
jgi:hypothetical protein